MTARATTLQEVAEQSDSLEAFGRHFRDWLHELRKHSSRPKVAAALQAEPPRLARRFAQGAVADAWLAAYAEHAAGKINHPVPAWTLGRSRVAPEPWFATETRDPRQRLLALRDSPAAFKRRNLFTPAVDLPLALRAGRPTKSVEEKRRVNAERQSRFRAQRQAEFKQLSAAAERR